MRTSATRGSKRSAKTEPSGENNFLRKREIRLSDITNPEQGHPGSSHDSKPVHVYRECNTATRLVEEGGDVIECNPTSKTVCVPKTRYEPEEYLDDECTTTTEEVCKTVYVRNFYNSLLIFSMLRQTM